MRARGTVEMEDLLVFISISLWEGANPSHGCEMRVMGGGGLEVSHPPKDARSGDASCCGVLSGGSDVCVLCDSCGVYGDYSE